MIGIKCNLAVLMAKRKIKKQADLHRMTGIRKNTISDLWNEEAVTISFQDLYSICKVLDCEVGELLELKHDPPTDKDAKNRK